LHLRAEYVRTDNVGYVRFHRLDLRVGVGSDANFVFRFGISAGPLVGNF
jgi:hypothetical protein